MEPVKAALALAPLAAECMEILVLMAAPKLHPRLRAAMPKALTAKSLRDLFARFGEMAAAFDKNDGLIDGADRFLRAARTLAKMRDATIGWQPGTQDPPEKAVDLARMALKHLGIAEPMGGWDAYEGEP